MKQRWSMLSLGVFLALFIVMLVLPESGQPSDFSLFLGRFHPLLVHLPIGILLVALLLELLRRSPRLANLENAVAPVLLAGAWTAVAACMAGLFLSHSGGYDEDVLFWHKWMGVSIAVLSTLAYAMKSGMRFLAPAVKGKGYAGALGLLLLLLVFGGHYGSILTHGGDYLTRYMPDPLRATIGLPPKAEIGVAHIENPEEAAVYGALIQPIFDDKCVSCHGPSKRKGGLQLDSSEGLLKGGDDGEVVVAGQGAESELVRRLWLPTAHDDHMPPEGKPQLSIAEAELIRWWIDQGAAFEQTLAEVEVTPDIQTIFDGLGLSDMKTGIFALDVDPPDEDDVETLRRTGLSVTPLAEDEPFLHVHATNVVNTLTDADLQQLAAVAPQVAWLDLARTAVTDDGLGILARLPHLTRLHLENTAVTDAALANLEGLEYLEYLNLYGTKVTDAGLKHLENLPRLRALYVWQTGVTADAAERLQAANPHLEVNLGWTPVVPAADTDSSDVESVDTE